MNSETEIFREAVRIGVPLNSNAISIYDNVLAFRATQEEYEKAANVADSRNDSWLQLKIFVAQPKIGDILWKSILQWRNLADFMKGNPTTKRLQQTRGMVSVNTRVPESIRAMLSGDIVKLSSIYIERPNSWRMADSWV